MERANRPFDPLDCLGRPLPDVIASLEQIPPDDLEPTEVGDVQPFHVTEATEAVAYRPTHMLATTVDDADLADDHPDVDVPGVTLETFLGGGGQGWVYAGRVRATGGLIAVKVLRADYLAAKGYAAREALLCSRVQHPNVLRVFHTRPAGPFWVVLMELVQGDELHTRKHTIDDLRCCLVRLADALCTLKRSNIVHCDIKPANILLRRRNGEPVLVDFGIAIDLQDEPDSRKYFGTPYFMAPEAIQHGRPSTAWDAYALGVTAAYILGVRHSYDSLIDVHQAKRSGAFHQKISTGLCDVDDAKLRDYLLALIHDDPDVRLAALDTTSNWLAV